MAISKCINSSKVYCKLKQQQEREKQEAGINSSKVYCKFFDSRYERKKFICINSSKVYCKSKMSDNVYSFSVVLIVAKCIVNILGLVFCF